jgi:hypothetical protein
MDANWGSAQVRLTFLCKGMHHYNARPLAYEVNVRCKIIGQRIVFLYAILEVETETSDVVGHILGYGNIVGAVDRYASIIRFMNGGITKVAVTAPVAKDVIVDRIPSEDICLSHAVQFNSFHVSHPAITVNNVAAIPSQVGVRAAYLIVLKNAPLLIVVIIQLAGAWHNISWLGVVFGSLDLDGPSEKPHLCLVFRPS